VDGIWHVSVVTVEMLDMIHTIYRFILCLIQMYLFETVTGVLRNESGTKCHPDKIPSTGIEFVQTLFFLIFISRFFV